MLPPPLIIIDAARRVQLQAIGKKLGLNSTQEVVFLAFDEFILKHGNSATLPEPRKKTNTRLRGELDPGRIGR